VRLVRDDATGRRVGRIVEVEAYDGPDDQASHARFGRTPRNAVMFGPAGVAYVYLVYGMYDCLNVVTGRDETPAAVLIRAVEPLEGIDLMRLDGARLRSTRRRRLASPSSHPRVPDARVASGPGLVGAAFGIDRSWTGIDLCDPASPLRLETGPGDDAGADHFVATPRIGIGYAGEPWASLPWRFSLAGHPSVSGARASR
jgi:DNA-3-methyladenine glycosylase